VIKEESGRGLGLAVAPRARTKWRVPVALLVSLVGSAVSNAQTTDGTVTFKVEPAADTADGMAGSMAMMNAQAPLAAAADDLSAFLYEQTESPLGSTAKYPKGFASIEIDAPGGVVTLFWKSGHSVPPAVSDFIERLNARPRIHVRVAAAALDLLEVLAEMEKIVRDMETHPDFSPSYSPRA
jgi:hypothetical protein